MGVRQTRSFKDRPGLAWPGAATLKGVHDRMIHEEVWLLTIGRLTLIVFVFDICCPATHRVDCGSLEASGIAGLSAAEQTVHNCC
jgi:hypothetical protein